MDSQSQILKPGAVGGTLIRKIISIFDEFQFNRPITSHILIAVSGGADSVALATLLARYGNNIIPKENISLFHVNHHLRGSASDLDESLVRGLGAKLSLNVIVEHLDPNEVGKNESLEGFLRTKRKVLFRAWAKENSGLVFTAHHADDLAETVLWRLLTGNTQSHLGGIFFNDDGIIRPLLRINKSELEAFLKEEGQPWREDESNESLSFQRNRIRHSIMRSIKSEFPRAVAHLVDLGVGSQLLLSGSETETGGKGEYSDSALNSLFQSLGLDIRRPNWNEIAKLKESLRRESQLSMKDGWTLLQTKGNKSDSFEFRYILEKTKSN